MAPRHKGEKGKKGQGEGSKGTRYQGWKPKGKGKKGFRPYYEQNWHWNKWSSGWDAGKNNKPVENDHRKQETEETKVTTDKVGK